MANAESILVDGKVYYSIDYINRQIREQKSMSYEEGFEKGKNIHIAQFMPINKETQGT